MLSDDDIQTIRTIVNDAIQTQRSADLQAFGLAPATAQARAKGLIRTGAELGGMGLAIVARLTQVTVKALEAGTDAYIAGLESALKQR